MLIISVRFSPKCSFIGQVAKCEVRTLNTDSNTKRTFTGSTIEEALDEFKKNDQSCMSTKVS
jgi:hypothetical protein